MKGRPVRGGDRVPIVCGLNSGFVAAREGWLPGEGEQRGFGVAVAPSTALICGFSREGCSGQGGLVQASRCSYDKRAVAGDGRRVADELHDLARTDGQRAEVADECMVLAEVQVLAQLSPQPD